MPEDKLAPDFYVNPDGTAVPKTGYRAIVASGKEAAKKGDIMSNVGDTYITFDDITKMKASEIKDFLQLPREPSVVAKFDNIQIIDDLHTPINR